MNKYILNIEIQCFINKNLYSDIHSILLKGTSFKNVGTKEIVEQIESKKRSEKKLPSWFRAANIYYPNKLNIEQTSSEITAQFKSHLVSGKILTDITGGFGVDAFYFSKKVDHVIHCEWNAELSQIASHNFEKLNASNVQTVAKDGIEYLKKSEEKFDWIYVDPSRRHETKGKVFLISECLPSIPEHLDLLFNRSSNILIKTSPLLDISAGLKELKNVRAIYVLAVKNEVKELLWILELNFNDSIEIKTVNIKHNYTETFDFILEDEKSVEVTYSEPLNFLYEPNSAVLKSGGFHVIAKKFNLKKLQIHSHLYTSKLLQSFPGRRFKILQILPYNKKVFKKLNIKKANITTRNFPESVETLRKKFKISDGGNHYIFFTINCKNEKIIILTLKITGSF